jgi:hypothetical protein
MSCSFFDSEPGSKPDWKAYVLRELGQDAHRQAEAHLATCSICHEEVATLRLTLDTLSTLREEEMPRRIAFVSDKVFDVGNQEIVPNAVTFSINKVPMMISGIASHMFSSPRPLGGGR